MVNSGLRPTEAAERLREAIRSVRDFPKPGIVFRDVTTLLKDRDAFELAVEQLAAPFLQSRIDTVVGIESRGFICGAALAHRLHAGFVPIRKTGKLPAKTVGEEYELEYGTDRIEIHADAIRKGDRVLLHDDLLATGGTMNAAVRLVERLGGLVVGISFLVELDFLHGREKISGQDIFSVIHYDQE